MTIAVVRSTSVASLAVGDTNPKMTGTSRGITTSIGAFPLSKSKGAADARQRQIASIASTRLTEQVTGFFMAIPPVVSCTDSLFDLSAIWGPLFRGVALFAGAKQVDDEDATERHGEAVGVNPDRA